MSLPILIFAAGFGTRMKALTQDRPKPMIEIAGKPLIDCAYDLALEAQASPRVVNTHYLPERLEAHLTARDPLVRISREEGDILETGGGLRKALPLLESTPVFTLNSDAIWRGNNPLTHLLTHWDPEKMDALLLLMKRETVIGHQGAGDFFLDPENRLIRRGDAPTAPYVYLGAQIIAPKGIDAIEDHAFSLNLLWNKMLENGRLYGTAWEGRWIDVGTKEAVSQAEALILEDHVI